MLTVLRILTTAARCLPRWTVSRRPRRITSLIRMPLSLTMITKLQITAWTLAAKSRTRRTTRRNDGIAAVGCWAPARVRIGQKHATHHKVFVFRYHIGMCLEQQLNVRRVHRLGALRARNVGARLGDLDGKVALEADPAGSVLTCKHSEHVVGLIVLHVAELALLRVVGGLLRADRWSFVAALWRCRLLHEHEGNAIDVTGCCAGALRCGVVVVALKEEQGEDECE